MTNDRSLPTVYGWAAFLACSWTWCIGMFLPVLFVRDYGFAGWLVFAIPNIVGAAAMGTVLAAPGASASVATAHRAAGIAFSIVTLCFHGFFLGWVVAGLTGIAAPLGVCVAGAAFYLLGRTPLGEFRSAWAALAVSLIAIVCYAFVKHDPTVITPTLGRPMADLLPLATVCILGFALCPYLDITFHRARSATAPVAGMSAFTIGFAGIFLVMILFTLWYADLLAPTGEGWKHVGRAAAWVIGAHMIVQIGFTGALHLREVVQRWFAPADRDIKVGTAVGFVLGLAPLLIARLPFPHQPFPDSGETTYRLYMAFYALVFPAYVWICMVPFKDASRHAMGIASLKLPLILFAAAVVVGAPFYWLGFMSGQMGWLILGVMVVVLSGIGIRLVRLPDNPAADSVIAEPTDVSPPSAQTESKAGVGP